MHKLEFVSIFIFLVFFKRFLLASCFHHQSIVVLTHLWNFVGRYELCFNGEKTVSAISKIPENDKEKHQSYSSSHASNGERNLVDRETVVVDVFRWSRCKKILPQKVMRSIGIPLSLEYLEVFIIGYYFYYY